MTSFITAILILCSARRRMCFTVELETDKHLLVVANAVDSAADFKATDQITGVSEVGVESA